VHWRPLATSCCQILLWCFHFSFDSVDDFENRLMETDSLDVSSTTVCTSSSANTSTTLASSSTKYVLLSTVTLVQSIDLYTNRQRIPLWTMLRYHFISYIERIQFSEGARQGTGAHFTNLFLFSLTLYRNPDFSRQALSISL